MTRRIRGQDLGVALDAARVKIGRTNRQPIRCAVIEHEQQRQGWGLLVAPGHAWMLVVDGHRRGFICERCWPPGPML